MPLSATETRVCLVTALPFESRPLLDRFRLRGVSDLPGLRCYRRDGILLLETGSGKLRAATAVAALLQHETGIRHIVNVGIAGGSEALGNWYIASSVHDEGSGRRWYPHLPPARVTGRLPAAEVCTLDRPSNDYRDGCLFDLELAGITEAVLHWRDTTAIQALKVVSDNTKHPATTLDRDRAMSLIASGMEVIGTLIEWLQAQPGEHSDEQRRIAAWIEHAAPGQSLSQTERRLLKRDLERYMARHQGRLPVSTELSATQWTSRLYPVPAAHDH